MFTARPCIHSCNNASNADMTIEPADPPFTTTDHSIGTEDTSSLGACDGAKTNPSPSPVTLRTPLLPQQQGRPCWASTLSRGMPAQTKPTGRPPSTSTHWSRHEHPSRPSPTPTPHRHPGLPAVAARALAGGASQRLHARHRSPHHPGAPHNNPLCSVRAGGTHGVVHATAPPARRRAPPARLGAAWKTLLVSDLHWLSRIRMLLVHSDPIRSSLSSG